jgi:hypothetical protein
MNDSRTTPGIPDPPLPFTGGRIPRDEAERRQVEWRVMAQYFVAPALSFAAVAAGISLGWPRLAATGVLGLGLSILANGLLAVRERRLLFIRGGTLTRREYRYFIYEGLAAVPYGLAITIAGTLLAVPAVLFLAGVEPEAMRAAVLARPHLLLIPGGSGLLLHGLGFCIGFGREAQSPRDRVAIALLHLPALLGGLILVALGGALLAIGLTEWLAPAVFRARFESLFGNPWPFS